ncbi:hypothetical protein ACVOMS_31895 [Bradyrhizobium guangxiense]
MSSGASPFTSSQRSMCVASSAIRTAKRAEAANEQKKGSVTSAGSSVRRCISASPKPNSAIESQEQQNEGNQRSETKIRRIEQPGQNQKQHE